MPLIACKLCKGTGRDPRRKSKPPCPKCKGRGTVDRPNP